MHAYRLEGDNKRSGVRKTRVTIDGQSSDARSPTSARAPAQLPPTGPLTFAGASGSIGPRTRSMAGPLDRRQDETTHAGGHDGGEGRGRAGVGAGGVLYVNEGEMLAGDWRR